MRDNLGINSAFLVDSVCLYLKTKRCLPFTCLICRHAFTHTTTLWPLWSRVTFQIWSKGEGTLSRTMTHFLLLNTLFLHVWSDFALIDQVSLAFELTLCILRRVLILGLFVYDSINNFKHVFKEFLRHASGPGTLIGQKSKSLLFSEITVPLTNSSCTSIFSRNAVQSSQIVKTGTITLEQKKTFESSSPVIGWPGSKLHLT